jgi:hypothetical protein
MPNVLKMLLLIAVLLVFGIAVAIVIAWHDEQTAEQRRCRRLDAIADSLPTPGTPEGKQYYADLHYESMREDLLGPYRVCSDGEIEAFRESYYREPL